MMPWVLLDVSYLAHQAWYAMGGLSYEGEGTGVIYGVLLRLLSIGGDSHIQSNRMVALFDSQQSHRRRQFSDYKRTRQQNERTPEEWAAFMRLKEQVERLRVEVLPAMGIMTHRQTGVEADDLLAQAAASLRYHHAYDGNLLAVIVTADSDLWQCLRPGIAWFDPTRSRFLTREGLAQERGVTPEQWLMVKVLAGCDGDGVPGIPGVGEKTAIGWVTGSLTKGARVGKIQAERSLAIIERNRQLVALPHARTRPFDLVEPQFNPDAFFQVCERMGFASILGQRRKDWERFFLGQLGGVRPIILRKRGRA